VVLLFHESVTMEIKNQVLEILENVDILYNVGEIGITVEQDNEFSEDFII